MDLMKESWQGGDAMMPSLSGPLLLRSHHTLAGIRSAETLSGAEFQEFYRSSSPVPDLLWLNASYQSPVGVIAVKWSVAPAAVARTQPCFLSMSSCLPGLLRLWACHAVAPQRQLACVGRRALLSFYPGLRR